MDLIFVKEANYISDYQIEILFSDGNLSVIDLEKHLDGKVFRPLKNKEYFRNFKVNNWTIEWENGADFSPEFLAEIAKKPIAHV